MTREGFDVYLPVADDHGVDPTFFHITEARVHDCPEKDGCQTVYLRDVTNRKYLINRYYASPGTVWCT